MCNAGVMAMPAGTTEDGFDTQMGVNVLGHWALIARLLPIVVATPGARVVTVSSTAQHVGKAIDPADPHMRNNFDPWRMYGQTKLAMRHLAVGLQRQFEAAGVDARALSAQPGLTNSDLQTTTRAHGNAGVLGAVSETWVKATGMRPDRGALSQLRAATDPNAPGGGFYGPMFVTNGPPICKPLVRPGSDAAIETLWQVAEDETGLGIDVERRPRRSVTTTVKASQRRGRPGTRRRRSRFRRSRRGAAASSSAGRNGTCTPPGTARDSPGVRARLPRRGRRERLR